MTKTSLRFGVLCLCVVPAFIAYAAASRQPGSDPVQTRAEAKRPGATQPAASALKVQYLEIVTPSVDEVCDGLTKAHGVNFSAPIAELGNARTARLKDGGRIGVRALMGEERPVVRPYILVDDIEAAVKAAEAAGAEVLMPPTEIPGQGTFAIYYLGKIEHGLWQL